MATQQIWPEGEKFTREVMIPTGLGTPEGGIEPDGYEDFPVTVTFSVPPFDVVVETWKNTDPAKSYGLFRQFIVSWDQEYRLTDKVLMGYLYAYPGIDEALFRTWCEHMKEVLATNNQAFVQAPDSIN
jgi:hypothetical protein